MPILTPEERIAIIAEISELLDKFQKIAAVADRLSKAKPTNVNNNFYIQLGETQRRMINLRESFQELINTSDNTTL